MNSLVGQRLWKWKLVAGVLTIVLGAIVLAWPGPTILVASTLFGVYLLLSGLAELFMAFTLPRSAATRVMLFISGALSVVLAILSFRHFGDAYAVLLLSLWIGIGFIFQGVSGVAAGIGESRPARPRLVRRRRHHHGDRRPRGAGVALRLHRRAHPGRRHLPRHHRHHPNRQALQTRKAANTTHQTIDETADRWQRRKPVSLGSAKSVERMTMSSSSRRANANPPAIQFKALHS